MNYYKIFLAFIIFAVGQLLVWFQLYGQLKWDFFKENTWVVMLSGIPITYMFYISTRIGTEGFDGQTWPVRLMGFCAGIVIFYFCSKHFLGEGINTKTAVSLLLCVAIMAIQLLWK